MHTTLPTTKAYYMNPRKSIIRMILVALGVIAIICILLSLSGCSGAADNAGGKPAASEDDNSLIGAGSTFVYPLFSKMFDAYNKSTGLKINYQSIGSGGGIQQITSRTVDFGGSDAPLNDAQTQKIGVPMLHIPMASGSFTWAIIYKEQNYNKRSKAKATNLAKLLWWNIHDGQQYCKPILYAPLAPAAVAVGEKILKSATYNNASLLP
jgi:ABC-type phosphate transport system substrate-binding protein